MAEHLKTDEDVANYLTLAQRLLQFSKKIGCRNLLVIFQFFTPFIGICAGFKTPPLPRPLPREGGEIPQTAASLSWVLAPLPPRVGEGV